MQEAARRYAEAARRRAGVPIHIRVGVNSSEVVVRPIGGDLKMDYTAVRRDYLARLMSSSAGVAQMRSEDLSGRGASGRSVSFTTVSPGARACSVRGPSEDRREHRKDSRLLMRFVQPESPSPHRRWAVSGVRGRACACIFPARWA